MHQWTRRGESNRIAARCELGSLFWSVTFLSRLHSALFAWALSTWLISSTCSWVDGSCPEQERADKLSSVSSFPRPLLSPDTTYEVNFTLSSLILALISRCLCHILRPCGAPCLQEEHVRSPGMPTAAGPSDTDLSHHPLQYVRMLPLYRDWCRPWDAIDQRELCLIFNRQTYSALFMASLLLAKPFVVSIIHLKGFKATRLQQTSVSSMRRLRQRQLKPRRVSRLGLHNSKPNNRTQRSAHGPRAVMFYGWWLSLRRFNRHPASCSGLGRQISSFSLI